MRLSLAAMHCTTTATCIPLLLFLAFTVTPAATSELCDPGDEAALLAIKTSLGANAKSFTTWKTDTPCCQWSGIYCISGRVDSVTLSDDDTISGTIPKEISGLSALTSLTLKNLPGLTGSIPSSICRLSKMLFLKIISCYIYGTIPSCLSDISIMDTLDLSDNKLTGEIPASLSEMTIFNLILKQNRLTGPIPASFGYWSLGGPSLDLSDNFLSGDIPASLADVYWSNVDLSNNELTGDGSVFIRRNNYALTTVLLGSNQLSFNLSEVEYPTNYYFSQLDLSHNKIYGTIPAGINEATGLKSLDVSYNLLCGEIPQGPVTARFDAKAYIGNECLCGSPLPACTTESGSAAADT